MNHTCVLKINKVVIFDGKTELDFWKSKEMQFEATFLWTPCKSFPTLAPPYLAKSSSKFLNHMVDEKKILQDST